MQLGKVLALTPRQHNGCSSTKHCGRDAHESGLVCANNSTSCNTLERNAEPGREGAGRRAPTLIRTGWKWEITSVDKRSHASQLRQLFEGTEVLVGLVSVCRRKHIGAEVIDCTGVGVQSSKHSP